MKMQQLTFQICGAYAGCEIQYRGRIGKMVGLDERTMLVLNSDQQHEFFPISESKLVLRPLESLTNEEALCVIEIEKPSDYDPKVIKKVIVICCENDCLSKKTIDYLRSIGIDTGYGTLLSLIDAGLAIEKQ
jgi:hypothetical protein